MSNKMLRAWVTGLSALGAAYVTWFLLLQLAVFSQAAAVALWAAPLVAGFATSYMGPSRKILLGASMALPSALLSVLLNWVAQRAGGAVDFPGPGGGLILFTLVLVGATVLASLGAVAGYLLTRHDG